MTTPIYAATIKKLVVAFSSLFDEISYYTEDTPPKLIRVPLTFATKEKWLAKVHYKTEFDSKDKKSTEMKMTYPAMAFELLPFNYAPERNLNPINRLVSDEDGSTSFNKIPFDFQFNLYITTKKLDDSLKIIEQIIPHFTPEYSITLTDNSLGLKNSVPIILNSSSFDIEYESDLTTTRDIMWTLNFTMKAYLYPAVVPIIINHDIIDGSICTLASNIPGDIEFHGSGTANACTGGTEDFTFILSGYLFPANSLITGIMSGTRTDNSTYEIPLECRIVIYNNILYGEASGYLENPLNPIKAINFTFNFDIVDGTIITISNTIPETEEELTETVISERCTNIIGQVSCSGAFGYKRIKKTIVDVTGDKLNRKFDRLISEVVPFTANKEDDYHIVDTIQNITIEDQ